MKYDKYIIVINLFCSTYDKVHKLCVQHMIVDHLELLNEECKVITKENCPSEMRNLYLLLSELKDEHELNRWVDIFREHLQSTGIETIKSLNQEPVCFKYFFCG